MKFTGELSNVNIKWVPIIVVGLFTYLAASMFLALYEETIMSLMTCVCYDMDANGGEPTFGPATFHDNYQGASSKVKDDVEE